MDDLPKSEDFYVPEILRNKYYEQLEDQWRLEVVEPAIDEWFKYSAGSQERFNLAFSVFSFWKENK